MLVNVCIFAQLLELWSYGYGANGENANKHAILLETKRTVRHFQYAMGNVIRSFAIFVCEFCLLACVRIVVVGLQFDIYSLSKMFVESMCAPFMAQNGHVYAYSKQFIHMYSCIEISTCTLCPHKQSKKLIFCLPIPCSFWSYIVTNIIYSHKDANRDKEKERARTSHYNYLNKSKDREKKYY